MNWLWVVFLPAAVVAWLVAVVLTRQYRVRCECCDGTGVCGIKPSKGEHSCCECATSELRPHPGLPEFEVWEGYGGEPNHALLGCGWQWGSLWQRLRRGGPPP